MTHSRRLLASLLLLPLLAAAPASQPADTTLDDAPAGSKWKGKRNHDHKDWDCTATIKSHEDNTLVLVTKDGGANGSKIEWTFAVTGNRLRLTNLAELGNTAGQRYEENGGGRIEGDQIRIEYRFTRDNRKKKNIPVEGQILLKRVDKK